MKTKVNEVPLIGPRGRKELLERIEELEKKVAELATAPPETHVLQILSLSDDDESEADALARLKLDGKAATKEALAELNPLLTIVETTQGVKLAICGKAGDTFVQMNGGYILTNQGTIDSSGIFEILISGDASHIMLDEI